MVVVVELTIVVISSSGYGWLRDAFSSASSRSTCSYQSSGGIAKVGLGRSGMSSKLTEVLDMCGNSENSVISRTVASRQNHMMGEVIARFKQCKNKHMSDINIMDS